MGNLEIAKESGLHDYEIVDIDINYSGAQIKLVLKSSSGEIYEFSIKNFLSFNITHEEKWGTGKYVCSSDIAYDELKKVFQLEIELNSGDQITVCYL